jgi:NAD(P)-dependent dehydrogenase (short-subunit alcohol dehydrogenase family)
MTELAGKVVLVTGASRGIGEAAAVALGREGAVVMLTARDGAQAMKVARRIVGDGG